MHTTMYPLHLKKLFPKYSSNTRPRAESMACTNGCTFTCQLQQRLHIYIPQTHRYHHNTECLVLAIMLNLHKHQTQHTQWILIPFMALLWIWYYCTLCEPSTIVCMYAWHCTYVGTFLAKGAWISNRRSSFSPRAWLASVSLSQSVS